MPINLQTEGLASLPIGHQHRAGFLDVQIVRYMVHRDDAFGIEIPAYALSFLRVDALDVDSPAGRVLDFRIDHSSVGGGTGDEKTADRPMRHRHSRFPLESGDDFPRESSQAGFGFRCLNHLEESGGLG